ncbi:MAG: ABC transporter ATP-binding protein [Phycisphaerales bacterium]|nr:ABC transporter ATP-binding protein [Phycisphaerales bacterium]
MPDTERPTADSARPAVRISGVHKSYRLGTGSVPALRGVDLNIDPGGITAIMGPSGSGKSTLLHLLAGLDRPDEGTIEVDGRCVSSLSERDLTLFRRRNMGIIFQQFNLLPALDATDNVGLPGMLDGMPEARVRARSLELLHELGLGSRSHHRPDALSGGEQQRVAIARALFFEPRVLLADEPTGNLDSESGARLWEVVERVIARHGSTVVVVTHEPLVAARCRHIHVLRDGIVAGSFEANGLDASDLALRAAGILRSAQ